MIFVELEELDRQGEVLDLDVKERRALARVADRVGVEWRPDGSVRVFASDHVGSVMLSDRITVRIKTKVPIANVLRLVSLAYRTLAIPPSVGQSLFSTEWEDLDWLALLVITEAEVLLTRGLRQGYVVVEESLPYVRGRLRFDVAASLTQPGLVRCEFADLLPDTPENRVVRATLEALAARRLLPGVRARAEQILPVLGGVSFARPDRRLLDACRITRLNQHYRPVLELCRLVLEHVGIDNEPGQTRAPTFFFPMAQVFEAGIANYLRDRLQGVRAQVSKTYQPVSGSPPRTLTITPDVVVGAETANVVLDTKYAKPTIQNRYGGRSFHNDHIYQAAFYALSSECPAVLVYPQVDEDIDVTFKVGGIAVTILTLDLTSPDLPGLDRLIERVESFADTFVGALNDS